jgi:hypothetical protein
MAGAIQFRQLAIEPVTTFHFQASIKTSNYPFLFQKIEPC